MSKNIGLILEGGGLRGLYTAGVLDFFTDLKLEFQSIFGVSAGACNALSYISGQRGRNYDVNISYCDDPRYISLSNYLLQGSMCGEDFMFHRIPEELKPFDYDAFAASPCRLTAVATDCVTGRAVYLPVEDCRTQMNRVLASSSLPLVSRMVEVDGHKMLDGGIADSIPLEHSISQGNTLNVLVLTRPEGYRKGDTVSSLQFRLRYPEYPRLVRAMLNRPTIYNHSLDVAAAQQATRKAVIIRPSRDLQIRRFERDRRKLHELYLLGYTDAKNAYDGVKALCRGAANVTLGGRPVE